MHYPLLLITLLFLFSPITELYSQEMIWRPIGGVGISDGEATHQSITVDVNGTVWLANKDHSEDPSDNIFGKLTVMKWKEAEGEWEAIGGPQISENRVRHISLAIHPGGFHWVAYSDHSFIGFPFGRKTTVLRWDGQE